MSKESKVLRVVFQGNEGYSTSVTHYYHFLFGALIPLLELHTSLINSRREKEESILYVICTDVGPMKSMLCELPLNILSLAGPQSTLSRKDAETHYHPTTSSSSLFILGNKTIALPAYDNFTESIFNDPHVSHLKKPALLRVLVWIRSRIPAYIRHLATYDVLLIERTDKETYFRDVKAVIDRDRPSGSSLRRIDNHRELETALAAVCAGSAGPGGKARATFANVSLERCSLFYQLHLFSNCKVVVAQHGAALSNIAFMVHQEDGVVAADTQLGQGSSRDRDRDRSAATAAGNENSNKKIKYCRRQVIEVNPPPSFTASKEHFKKVARQHFRNLSSLAGVTYRCVWQEHDTAPVDVGHVAQALDEALNDLGHFIHPSNLNDSAYDSGGIVSNSASNSSSSSGGGSNGIGADCCGNDHIDSDSSNIGNVCNAPASINNSS